MPIPLEQYINQKNGSNIPVNTTTSSGGRSLDEYLKSKGILQTQVQKPTEQKALSGKTLLKSGKDANVLQKTLNTAADVAGSRGFGETIGGLLTQKKTSKTVAEANENLIDAKNRLVADIKQKEAQGRDTTNLRKALNEMDLSTIDSSDVNPILKKTTRQVAGEALEFGAGTIGSIFGAGGAKNIGQQAAKKSVSGFAKALGSQALRSGVEGAVGGFGVGLQNTDNNKGDATKTAAFTAALSSVLGSGAPGRAASKVGSGFASVTEGILGKTTGVGDDVIRQAVDIVTRGGGKKEAFVDALRGKVSADDIVDKAKNALGEIKAERSRAYKEAFEKIDFNKEIDINPIKSKFKSSLKDFNLNINRDGEIIWKGSRIAEKTQRDVMQSVVDEMIEFGNNPNLRDANNVDDMLSFLETAYNQTLVKGRPSKASAFIESMRKEIRSQLGKQVQGYDSLKNTYSESTRFINDIEKMLSLSDKATRETSFKKIVGALRDNNEIRQRIVVELDDLTGGSLLSNIAGQQLSETISRGIVGSLAPIFLGGSVVGASAAGAISPVFLISLLTLSPRFIGEAINALRLPLRAKTKLKQAIINMKNAIGPNEINRLRNRAGQSISKEIFR